MAQHHLPGRWKPVPPLPCRNHPDTSVTAQHRPEKKKKRLGSVYENRNGDTKQGQTSSESSPRFPELSTNAPSLTLKLSNFFYSSPLARCSRSRKTTRRCGSPRLPLLLRPRPHAHTPPPVVVSRPPAFTHPCRIGPYTKGPANRNNHFFCSSAHVLPLHPFPHSRPW